ncbi:MAG: hypothetical protein ACREA7_04385 [Nitrosotalea sp.]
MKIFSKKFSCDQCKNKFESHEELISHASHEHHHDIIKCTECGQEFIHEKDRLHHARKEHKQKLARCLHRSEHKHEIKNPSPQDEVDAHARNFGDNF